MEKGTVGVVGLGLIGASMCKALGAAGYRILGTDTDGRVQQYALLTGTVAEELTEEKIPECGFLFLAVYPAAAVETLERLAPRIRQETIVCDLCGVKLPVCGPCFALAEKYGFSFIGGHPMAGKQFSGIKYADENLYRGASMILVPRKEEDLFVVSRLSSLLREAGFGSVTLTTAERHDRIIAYTSQLPHVISSAYIKSPTAAGNLTFAAGSYRDMTRVAGLNATMWTELFLDNAECLGIELECLIRSLQEYRDAIAAGDAQALKRLLEEGNACKAAADAERKK